MQDRGWAAGIQQVDIKLEDKAGREIPCHLERLNRVDVQNQFSEMDIGEKSGFYLEVDYDKQSSYRIIFQAGTERAVFPVPLQRSEIMQEKFKLYCKKSVRYLKMHGISGFSAKYFQRLKTIKIVLLNTQNGFLSICLPRRNLHSREKKNLPGSLSLALWYRYLRLLKNIWKALSGLYRHKLMAGGSCAYLMEVEKFRIRGFCKKNCREG